MKAVKPTLARGTRDFLPQMVLRRRHILNTLQAVFEAYGYAPIETPAMENLSVLAGKYGEEGDRLMFKVARRGEELQRQKQDLYLNLKRLRNRLAHSVDFEEASQFFTVSSDWLPEVEDDRIDVINPIKSIDDINRVFNALKESLDKQIEDLNDLALRYDLTVPFARFVVMHQNELTFPFKRYQIQPVWRADRPQRGRYREFTQCDADVVGSASLVHEAEFIAMYAEAFRRLSVPVTIHLNNRKVLAGIAAQVGAPDRLTDITVAIDKLDKIGREAVEAELRERGLSDAAVAALAPVFELTGDNDALLDQLHAWLQGNAEGLQGVAELREVLRLVRLLPTHDAVLKLDLTLARGLNYYTGAILEVKGRGTQFTSSIGGGGRYDNLTALFGGRDLPGAGISFGVDRIYDVLEELNAFPATGQTTTQVLIVNFGGAETDHALQLAAQLRPLGLATEVYPDSAKLGKQFGYADGKGIPYVVVAGEAERAAAQVKVKRMADGVETLLPVAELAGWLNAAAR